MPYRIGDHAQRPWGEWGVLHVGAGFAVKIITVLPGGRLSLQRHRHRTETWVLASGEVSAECDGQVARLLPGDPFLVPVGSLHRMTNSGSTPAVVIEIQRGDRLSEDDIERVEDDYGRSQGVAA